MVILGFLLLVLGVAGIMTGVFTSSVELDVKEPEVLAGLNMSTAGLFIFGAVSASFVWIGLWCMKYGAKQGMKHRKEQKKLNELSEKLERAEAERRRDDDPDNG